MSLSFCQCGGIKGQCGCQSNTKPTYKTTTERGYGNDWTKLSRRFRKANPLCWRCLKQGRTTPTEQAHHIIPIIVNPTKRLDWENLAAGCEACHAEWDNETRAGKPFVDRPTGD